MMNICGKFHCNPITEYWDITLGEMCVLTDGQQTDNQMTEKHNASHCLLLAVEA